MLPDCWQCSRASYNGPLFATAYLVYAIFVLRNIELSFEYVPPEKASQWNCLAAEKDVFKYALRTAERAASYIDSRRGHLAK